MQKKNIIILLAFLLLYLAYAVLSEQDIYYEGRVIKVVDGDSITLLTNNKQIKIRLAEIDTPEKGQPYWRVSRKALSDLVADKNIIAKQMDVDRYNRVVAKIYIDDVWVNEALVKSGYAWVYPKYANSRELYYAQDYAKENQLGIWSLPEKERLPPWEWRRMK